MKLARDLHPVPLADVLPLGSHPERKHLVMTMSEGQWDALLASAYAEGWVLLELNEDEVPVRAYQKVGGDL